MWTHYLGKHRYGAKWTTELMEAKEKGKEMAPPPKVGPTSFEPGNFRQQYPAVQQQVAPTQPHPPQYQQHYMSPQQQHYYQQPPPNQSYHPPYSQQQYPPNHPQQQVLPPQNP